MSNGTLDLQSMGISSSNLDASDIKNIKKIARELQKINSGLADLMDASDRDDEEIKAIKSEIKRKVASLLDRQKELKQNKKKRTEERLLMLGERRAHIKELKTYGVQPKFTEPSEVVKAGKANRALIEAEV
jgi:Skp family chaperone for outer membrane proteins